MSKQQFKIGISFFIIYTITSAITACSNSEYTKSIGYDSPTAENDIFHPTTDYPSISDSEYSYTEYTNPIGRDDSTTEDEITYSTTDYLPINDSEYPYAGIPRIIIETENLRQIRDRETEIPAKLQIWGKHSPESDIVDLTIKGRGNSSWYMPKKGYKIEFIQKQAFFNMPKEKDWALIANYIDKTLLRNTITHNLAEAMNFTYTPKAVPVELYLNKEYMGVYLFSETIKIGKNRVNIPNTSNSYLVEFDEKYKNNEPVIATQNRRILNIHSPKDADSTSKIKLRKHINTIEDYIFNTTIELDSLSKYIDFETYLKFYWIEELSKNNDGAFFTSVYFSWVEGQPLQMGPIWDFDQAYGNHPNIDLRSLENWFIRNSYWNKSLFKDSSFVLLAKKTWQEYQIHINAIIDSLDIYKKQMSQAAKNNFKRWPILSDKKSYDSWANQRYSSYEDAVDALKHWLASRIQWINENL